MGLLTVLLTLAIRTSVPWGQNEDNKIAQIKSRGELRISTITSPLTYTLVNGSPTGMDYELAKHFADYLGVRLRVTLRQNLSELFSDLEENRADILAAGLNYNKEQLERLRAGPAYYSVSQQLVYRVNQAQPKNLGNLKGCLAVTANTSYLSTLQKIKQQQYHHLNWIISANSTKTLLEDVASGKLDYTIGDSVTIGMLQRVHPQLAVAFDITEENSVNWFMSGDEDFSLDAAMLDFFNQMREEGVLARLWEKYLGYVGIFDYVDTRTFLRAIDRTLPVFRPLFERHANDFDWHLLAAMSYQESHWNPRATSPTGVRGLMMLTRNTAASLNIKNRLNPEQSIRGGSEYLQHLIKRIPATIPDDERIWFALAAYNMGYSHMLDARVLTGKQNGNPNSWADVKMRLPMLGQKRYYSQTIHGYARGHEAYAYVENIRKYQISLVGYLQEKERKRALQTMLAKGYPAVEPTIALN